MVRQQKGGVGKRRRTGMALRTLCLEDLGALLNATLRHAHVAKVLKRY